MDAVLYRTIGLVLMVIRLTLLAQGKAFLFLVYFTCPNFALSVVTIYRALDISKSSEIFTQDLQISNNCTIIIMLLLGFDLQARNREEYIMLDKIMRLLAQATDKQLQIIYQFIRSLLG